MQNTLGLLQAYLVLNEESTVSPSKMNLTQWQDYRGKSEGILLYMPTIKTEALPMRDILNELGKGFEADPNYETNTLNFFSCKNSKNLGSVIKNRRRYLFLGTSYQGTLEAYQGKFILFGYIQISKTFDPHKRHVHQYMGNPQAETAPECMDQTQCFAVYSEVYHLYSAQDAFELTEKVMKSWGHKGRVAKHMKLTFTTPQVEQILAHFNQVKPINHEYIAVAQKLELEKAELIKESTEAEQGPEDTGEW